MCYRYDYDKAILVNTIRSEENFIVVVVDFIALYREKCDICVEENLNQHKFNPVFEALLIRADDAYFLYYCCYA